jgi:hypothetical protein
MMGAPKRIFAWSVPPTAHLVGTWCVTSYPDAAQEYILATEHDRIVAEKDAEIARLREALLDATAHLIAAAASYRTYARRGGDIRPRAEVDAFFTTRARDYDRAAERARAALGDDNG